MTMTTGFFITLEGGEGSGKSTQSVMLAKHLEEHGHEVVLTREPGGAPGAEVIRQLLVTGTTDRWSPLAESLLFSAARDEHLRTTIRPALAQGAVVISDRFADSTRAYQGAAGGADPDLIDTLEKAVVGDTQPDLTFILDLPPQIGIARAVSRQNSDASVSGAEDRFERKTEAFHHALRAAFQAIAKDDPERCEVVNADQPEDAIAAEIWFATAKRLTATMLTHG